MHALILHDETGQIVSLAVTEAEMDLQLLPGRGEFVLAVEPREFELGDVTALIAENVEHIRTSLARAQERWRVDVHALRPANRLIQG